MKLWDPTKPVERGIRLTEEEVEAFEHLRSIPKGSIPKPSDDNEYILWRVGLVLAAQPVRPHVHDQDCGRA